MSMEQIQRYHQNKDHSDPIEHCRYCWDEQIKCWAKMYRYTNRTEAALNLVLVNKQRKARGESPLRPYECQWCDEWHYTRTKQRGQSKRQRNQMRHEMIVRELERRANVE